MRKKILWVIANPTVELMLLLGQVTINSFINIFIEIQEDLTILMCNNNIVFLQLMAEISIMVNAS